MRPASRVLVGLALPALTFFAAVADAGAPAAGSRPRALVGGALVDGTGSGSVPDSTVVFANGKITCAGSRAACPVPPGADVVDAAGMWVTPGLVDAHVHFSQTGWADGRPDALDLRELYPYEQVEADLRAHPERYFASYLCSGVTAVFDVGGYPWTWDLRTRVEGDPRAPHVAAAGPLLSTRDHWLNLPAERQFIYLADEAAARNGVRYLHAFGTNAVKVWFIVVKERPFEEMAAAVRAAGLEARRLGLPLIVHATGLKEAKEALRSGARMLVHSVTDLPVDEEFISLARTNHTIYCPTLTVFGGYVRMFDAVLAGKAPAIDDPNGCVDAATRAKLAAAATLGAARVDPQRAAARRAAVPEQEKIAAANLKAVSAAGITVAMGTDAGNPLTLHGVSVYAEMEAMQAAGLSPMQVLVDSTRNGAQALGRAADLGTVEAGKIADLLVLGADPTADAAGFRKVRFVVRSGVVHPIGELRVASR
jgi:imidazolonepropionase-like amidohydrolase